MIRYHSTNLIRAIEATLLMKIGHTLNISASPFNAPLSCHFLVIVFGQIPIWIESTILEFLAHVVVSQLLHLLLLNLLSIIQPLESIKLLLLSLLNHLIVLHHLAERIQISLLRGSITHLLRSLIFALAFTLIFTLYLSICLRLRLRVILISLSRQDLRWLLRDKLIVLMSNEISRVRRFSLASLKALMLDFFINLWSESAFFKFLLLHLFSFLSDNFVLLFLVLIKSFMQLRDWLGTSLINSHKELGSLEAISDHLLSKLSEIYPILPRHSLSFVEHLMKRSHAC